MGSHRNVNASAIDPAARASRTGHRAVLAALLAFGCTAGSAHAQTMASAAAVMPPSPWQGPAAAARQGELRVGLTPRTQLVYEPRPWQPATPLPTDYAVRRPQESLGLEFKSASKDQSVKSLLRVQLSGDSVLQFRPRGGGMTVTYKSQF